CFRLLLVPTPRPSAASFPFPPLPGFHRAGETDLCFRTRAVHSPDLLPRLHIICGHESANTKFTAADAGDHFVFDDHGSRSDRLSNSVITLLHPPHFLTGFRVECGGPSV